MKLINMRPLALWAVCLMLGILVSTIAYLPRLLFALICIISIAIAYKLQKKYRVWLIAVLFLCIGMAWGDAVLYSDTIYKPSWKAVEIEGTLNKNAVYDTGRTALQLTNVSIGDQRIENVLLECDGKVTANAGDEIRCKAVIQTPRERWKTYYLSQGVTYLATASEATVTPKPLKARYIPMRIAGGLQTTIAEIYGEQAGLITGMLLGDRSGISDETYAAFQDTGTIHILAISGLHMGFVAAMAAFFCKRLRPKWRFVIVVGALWLYCFVVGMPTSATRACVMTTCALLGEVLGEKRDILSSMSAAAIIILLLNPAQLFSYGFLLSFAAVLGIALFANEFERILSAMPNVLSTSLSVSLSAQLGITPVLMHLYGAIQPVAVIANLLIVPLASVIVMGALLSVFIYLLLPALAMPFIWAVRGICMLMEICASLFAKIPFASILVPYLPVFSAIAMLFLLFLLSPYYLPKGKKRVVPALACMAVIILSYLL